MPIAMENGAPRMIAEEVLKDEVLCHSSVNNEIPQTGVFSGRF